MNQWSLPLSGQAVHCTRFELSHSCTVVAYDAICQYLSIHDVASPYLRNHINRHVRFACLYDVQ